MDAKWPLLNLWYITVGSNFIIHLVVQLPFFIEEEVELQRRGMVKTTQSLCVPAEGRTVLSLGSLPGAYFCSPEPGHFMGKHIA